MVNVIDSKSRFTLFAGSPAEVTEFLAQWGLRVVGSQRGGVLVA
jgi:hypothetical protein